MMAEHAKANELSCGSKLVSAPTPPWPTSGAGRRRVGPHGEVGGTLGSSDSSEADGAKLAAAQRPVNEAGVDNVELRREAMLAEGMATARDVARWEAAFERMDAAETRPTLSPRSSFLSASNLSDACRRVDRKARIICFGPRLVTRCTRPRQSRTLSAGVVGVLLLDAGLCAGGPGPGGGDHGHLARRVRLRAGRGRHHAGHGYCGGRALAVLVFGVRGSLGADMATAATISLVDPPPA